MTSHTFNDYNYKHPTWCDKCSKMLFGLYKQGVKCEVCDYNAHKACAEEVAPNCGEMELRRSKVCIPMILIAVGGLALGGFLIYRYKANS